MSEDLFTIGINRERAVQGNLYPRPTILTDSKPVTTATSFTGRAERHHTWIRREKHQFIASIRSILSQSETSNEELRAFLRQASSDCAISLETNLARVGNFELIEPLVGTYSSNRIFDCSTSRQINERWEATLTFQASPEARTVAYAHVRFRGGLGQADGAIIFDRIFTCEGHQPIVLQTPEPPSYLEIEVYNSLGFLVDSMQSTYLRSLGIGIQDVVSPASPLPPSLRNELTRTTMQTLSSGLTTAWAIAERESAEIQNYLYPPDDKDFFAFRSAEQHKAFFAEFIIGKANQQRLLLIDAYFDQEVLRTYVLKNRNRLRCDLTIVVSCRSEQAVRSIRDFCDYYASRLPQRIRIINLPDAVFHDRFAVIGTGNQQETWHLGSSLNSYARRYPLFAVRASGKARFEWAEYAEGLVHGSLGGGYGVTEPQIVFAQEVAPPWRILQPRLIAGETRRFPGCFYLLDALKPRLMHRWYDCLLKARRRVALRSIRGAKAIQELNRADVLMNDPKYGNSWATGAGVARHIPSLAKRATRSAKLLYSFAEWSARSGPKAKEYHFDESVISRMAIFLKDAAQSTWHGPPPATFGRPTSNAPFEAILAYYQTSLSRGNMLQLGFRKRWVATFFRDTLLERSPVTMFDVLDDVKSNRLYDLMLYHRVEPPAGALEKGLRHKGKAVVALSILLLREYNAERTLPERAETTLDRFEYASLLSLIDPGAPEERLTALVSRYQDITLTPDLVQRLDVVLNATAGLDRSFALDALADACGDQGAFYLRELIIDAWLAFLPRRGQGFDVSSSDAYPWHQLPLLKLVAKQYSALPDGPRRCAIVLAELNLGMGNAPFLRVRHFLRWSAVWEAIMVAIIVGLLVTTIVPDRELFEAVASLLAAIPQEVINSYRGAQTFEAMVSFARDCQSPAVQRSLNALLT